MWETWVWFLGWEDLLEKEMATHSSILAWRIPWTEELGGLQSTGRKESDTTEWLHFTRRIKEWAYRDNNTITAIKNTLEGINSRISEAGEQISELENKMVEITYEEQNKSKKNDKNWA